MNITIISFSEGILDFKQDVWKSIESKNNVSIDAFCQLRYSKESEFCGIQFDFVVNDDDKLILKYGFLFGIVIEDWIKLLEGINLEDNKSPIEEILRFIWPGVVGAIAAKTASAGSSPIIIPAIDEKAFTEQVILVRSGK